MKEKYEIEDIGATNQRVAIFNSQYEAYFGKERSRQQAAAICHLAENNNKKADAPYISCPSPSQYEAEEGNALSKYTIKGEYDTSTGYICSITITRLNRM